MVRVEDLAREIANQVEQYTEDVEKEVEAAKKETSKKGVATLKQTSPKKSGDYRKGWRVKKVGNESVIHNATHYQLTHLLEHGHAKAGGGRVPAHPHIRPVEEQVSQEFVDRVERAIQR
ncbi:HK97 gp10 family phage protein [Bacillus paranthracis]|uniref:HK97 gp10 family phage protein n=1 Tax=Bacillus paranthracis TaxID=2026186 RepID=UPI0020B810E7|nr:HK97 gp10 family phage protein [Bacillus paranthracis]